MSSSSPPAPPLLDGVPSAGDFAGVATAAAALGSGDFGAGDDSGDFAWGCCFEGDAGGVGPASTARRCGEAVTPAGG